MTDNIQDLCGTTIGERYNILKVLGEGGMGAVYLADDNDLGRQVAIKVLRQSLVDSPALARRLEMECTLLAHLGSHANIVTLLDRQTYDDKTILVMEYVPGENLSDIIERTFQRTPFSKAKGGQPSSDVFMLTPRNAILVAMQCLKALDYAHSRGVLHRDIKPSNIMVRADHGGSVIAKLMDFGIAKTLKESSVDTAFTRLTKTEDRAPGTPAYMAPEQIEPDRFGEIGPGTDIYAFGVMFFEMLTGKLPFSGGFTELMHAHTNVRPPSPREVNPLIKAELAHVVIRALQKSPANRYKTAGEMLEALEAAVGMSPTYAMQSKKTAKAEIDATDAPKKGRSQRRRVLMLLLLTTILGVAFWQGWTNIWFEGDTDVSVDTVSAEITPEQARTIAMTLKETADTDFVRRYASHELERAERVLQEADEAEEAVKKIELYTEAGRLFGNVPGIAYDREAREREREAQRRAEREGREATAEPEEKERPEVPVRTIPLGGDVALDMVWIEPGSFMMGNDVGRGRRGRSAQRDADNDQQDERPARTVRITEGFWMGRYEVTQAQWLEVMGNNPARFSNDLRLPVEQVSWHDCQAFLERLNEITDVGVFRLPTEAEWEYACRAGSPAVFSFGNELAALTDHAWYAENSNAMTQQVGTKQPNAWGLYDMHGNVAEWVQDWYAPDYYANAVSIDPQGPRNGIFRVNRGGAWSNHYMRLRSACRSHNLPDMRSDMIGLRVVMVEQ